MSARADFDRLFTTGRRRHHGGVTVVRAHADHDDLRVAVIAGRRVGGAVQRNRAKRRLRAALAHVPMLPRGEDVAVIASPAVLGTAFPTLVGWLRDGLGSEVMHGR